jgi:hypothetical protein
MILWNLTILCGNKYETKLHHANTWRHTVSLLLVLCDADSGKYEQLFHQGVFSDECLGAWNAVHGSINQVMTVFQQRFRKPSPHRETLIIGKTHLFIQECKRFSLKWLTNILNSNVCCCHWTITAQICMETISGSWSTSFDRVWPHEEGSGDEVSSVNVHNQTQRCWHELTSWSTCFAVGKISYSLVYWKISFQANT